MDELTKRLAEAMLPPGSGASLSATRNGGQVFVEPLTTAAEAWLQANTDEEAMWLGPSLVVEMRYWPQLAEAAIEAGLTFEREAKLN